MSHLFLIGVLATLMAIIVGLIKPAWVKVTSRKKVIWIYGLAFILCFGGFGMSFNKSRDENFSNHIHVKVPKKKTPQEKVELDMDEIKKNYEKRCSRMHKINQTPSQQAVPKYKGYNNG